MLYLITFLEGLITFISPCLLPMLPIYLAYFAGQDTRSPKRTALNALAFVAGFTVIFMLMGALAGFIGRFFILYSRPVNMVLGAIVVLFGLSFLGLFDLPFFRGIRRHNAVDRPMNPVRALIFGMVFSLGWTPCVGAFLGSALILASQQGSVLTGLLMLLTYALGLGIPFLLSALLLDRLRSTLDLMKWHQALITRISGILLILLGILMMTGLMNRWLTQLSLIQGV